MSRRVRRRCTPILYIAAALMIAGCATPEPTPVAGYRTIPESVARDTTIARVENANGLTHLEKGELEKAVVAFQRALTADVTFGPAHNNLGKTYYLLGDLYQAAWEFEYAAKLMPDIPEPKSNLGMVYESIGKLDDAVQWYADANRMCPDNAEIIGNLARARLRRGDEDEMTRVLLTELILKDTRPDWVAWARERLALMGAPVLAP